jgi:type VI secretion system secreted protein VgrG
VANYTQADRLVSVTTVLGPDALMLTDLAGTEGVSQPFSIRLSLVSEDPAIAGGDLLRTPAAITILTEDGGKRAIHGLINRFSQAGKRDDLTVYQAEVVPWLWFLTLSRDCRIFQHRTVPEIVEEVFQSLGYGDFDIRCTASHPKREYCVQYRETHFDFISRLLEEEGIFYFFEHTDSKHTMVIADNNGAMVACPQAPKARMAAGTPGERDVVTSFVQEHAIHVGRMTSKNYDFLQPSLGLLSTVEGRGKEEVYDYPGRHTTPEEGDRVARLRLEMEEAQGRVMRGASTCRGLQAGFRFDLQEHYRADLDQPYILLQVHHTASAEDYRSWGSATSKYQNSFQAIPASVPFRPVPATRRALVYGSQTARVVGPAGEEIYVDAHSRVKVQFYWDRVGKKDEHSSCWVRVATMWAGKTWGAQHVPRIGQEVVVQFLEGDPDQPIIVGSVYNAEQQPTFQLPGSKTISGVRSRSSRGGGTDNFNEISMQDEKGGELLYIHAEKDQTIVVENDRSDSVGHDEAVSIGNDHSRSIGHDREETVGNDVTISVGANRTESVGKDETVSIAVNRSLSVGKNDAIDIGQNRTLSVGKDEDRSVAGKRSTQVAKDESLQVGKKLTVEAGDEIVLRTGSASITMKKNGDIVIKGKNLTLQASGKITGKASSDVILKGSKVINN